MKRKRRLFNRNIAATFCILQMSHLRYYELSYSLKDYFGDRFYMASGETDSIIGEVRDNDGTFIRDLQNLQNIFDFSNLDPSSPLYFTLNADKIGVLRLEQEHALEFVKLKSKNYAIRTLCKICRLGTDENGADVCFNCNSKLAVIKGAPKHSKCPFEFYLSALKDDKKFIAEYNSLKASREHVTLCKRSRKFLAVQVFKRVWAQDAISSLPFGHCENRNDGN